MRTLRVTCCAAAVALVAAMPARADESNKLTYLTFSAPVDLPGISLPAGRYRFEIADPVESRRVIKVSSDDGQKVYGMLLTIPNKMMDPAKDPVVMFQEVPAGAPHPVKAWFYPGESIGYEFVYPHDQALKIAKANHEPVLASDKDNKVGRVNEKDQFTALNSESASNAKSNEPTLANSGAVTTVDRSNRAENKAASSTTASTSAKRSAQSSSRNAPSAVGTSGQTSQSNRSATSNPSDNTAGAREANRNGRELPRTASTLPWLIVFSGLSLGAGLAVRQVRKATV